MTKRTDTPDSDVTDDPGALLLVCLQDLHAGKRLLASGLESIAGSASATEVRAILSDSARAAREQQQRLAALGHDLAGPPNLWMAGIMDDAERDTRTIAPGPLLDIAMVGAVRKAKAAETVSTETAIALARQLSRERVLEVLLGNHAEEMQTDRCLAALLPALAAAAR